MIIKQLGQVGVRLKVSSVSQAAQRFGCGISVGREFQEVVRRIFYKIDHGMGFFSAGPNPFFRSTLIGSPEDVTRISENGHVTLRGLGVIPDTLTHYALPDGAPLANRIMQFHGGSPYPMNHNFIGVHQNPRATLKVAMWVNRITDNQALLRLDEIRFPANAFQNVHSVTKAYHSQGMNPADPGFALEEYVHEGSIPPQWIVQSHLVSAIAINMFGAMQKIHGERQSQSQSIYAKHIQGLLEEDARPYQRLDLTQLRVVKGVEIDGLELVSLPKVIKLNKDK